MLKWIKNQENFNEIRRKHKDYLVLLFWGDFSPAAGRALSELKRFTQDYRDIPVYAVDVGKIKTIHKEYGVHSVPTILTIKNDKVLRSFEGVESAAFYGIHLGGAAPAHLSRPAKKKVNRVTVYSGPGCPACGTLKAYLRQNNISFREIDIGRDQQAAEKLIKRSGQRAIPQTDINGRLVVGFDQNKLNNLLGIKTSRRES